NRLKMSKEQVEKVKPNYLKGPMMAQPYILLPERRDGELQFIDLSYFAPWGGWTQPMKTAKFIPQPLQVGNPFIMMYNAYVLGFDPFSGREIAPNYLTFEEQRQAKNKYLGHGLLPDLLGGRATERILKVVKDEPDYYGRKPDWKREVLRDFSGVNIILGGERTTGVATWKAEQIRADIERKRPVKLSIMKFLKTKDPEAKSRMLELLNELPADEQESILQSAIKEFAAQKSGMPQYFKLPTKQKIEYEKFLQTE
ncbi:MAG: hypothetical protein PHF74_08135, partial [Dehalococcoidales bacterium]|nr:hypothetical protein [Dehalococcoidales bacterium]